LKLREVKQFFNNILKHKPKENHMKIINNSYGLIFNILLTALVLVLISACGAPPPTPVPAPAPAPALAPIKDSRKVVEDWFAFAQKKEWYNMESIARKAWIFDGVFCPWLCAKEIAWHYRSITILSYKITTISDADEKLHSYQVIVKTPSGDETMQVKVYKEFVSGQESTDGIWGVDPII
jgi:hypothetical protein|tara:strand:+ start:1271 stop:1810 length:540 start_codon:yes stop_codon:yes gene_type:complete